MKKIFILLYALISLSGVKALAQCMANAGGDRSSCDTAVILGGAVAANGGTPPYTYLWSVNNMVAYMYLDDATKPNPTLTGYPSGDSVVFELKVTDAGGATCTDETVVYLSRFIIYLSFPAFHNIHQGDSVLLSGHILIDGNFPVAGYLWSPATGLSSTTSSAAWAKPDVSTDYYIKLTDDKGCTSQAVECYRVNVLPPLGIGESGIRQSGISVYPNPAKDKVYIAATTTLQSVLLCDMAGGVLYRGNSKEVNLQPFKAGIYILNVTDAANHTERFKIVKQ